VPTSQKIAVPAKYRVGAHEQPELVQLAAGQAVSRCGEQRSVVWPEPYLLAVQLALQDGDLVAHGEDLRVLVPVAHR
jgi:hypothetical protein